MPGQRTPKPRTVPGAGAGAATPNGTAGQPNGKQNKKKKGAVAGSVETPAASASSTPVQEVPPPVVEDTADDAEAEALQKKIRNLNKKVCCIGIRLTCFVSDLSVCMTA